jgi:hypothetical protein
VQVSPQCCFYPRNYFCYWVKWGQIKIRNNCKRILWGKGTRNETPAFKWIFLISVTWLLLVLLKFIIGAFALPSYAHMFSSLFYASNNIKHSALDVTRRLLLQIRGNSHSCFLRFWSPNTRLLPQTCMREGGYKNKSRLLSHIMAFIACS